MSRTILIVEDEKDILALEKLALEREGYRCVTAGHPDDALRILGEETPDLIILDIVLPGRPGYDLAREIRQRPETSSTPILCITARVEPVTQKIAIAAGADAFIAKPFSLDDVVENVNRRIQAREGSGPKRILVADDDPEVLASLRLALESVGAEVDTASNGTEALRRVQENPPALVLLDVVMPGMTGFEVCQELKGNSETAAIPVLIFTGESDPGYAEWARSLGADGFLTKESGTEQVVERVRELLGS